jgi:KDO2-lipid IV(A) lauroyltransferase
VLLYYSWRVAVFLRRLVPTQVCYLVSALAGEVIWRFFMAEEKKSATRSNLARATGLSDPKALESLGRKTYRNYARLWADFVRFPTFSPEQIRDRLITDRWPYVDEVLARGKGLIFVTLHMGNWDLAAGACAHRGYEFNVIAERFANPWIDRLVNETRRALRLKVVFEDRPLEAFRALKRNEILALLIDIPDERGVSARLLGATAMLPAGPARLALRSGAGIIAISFYKRGGDTLYAHVAPPIIPEPGADEASDVSSLTQRLASSFEPMIKANPDQWYVFRDLWRDPGQTGR